MIKVMTKIRDFKWYLIQISLGHPNIQVIHKGLGPYMSLAKNCGGRVGVKENF
jgi:hypothetical protein